MLIQAVAYARVGGQANARRFGSFQRSFLVPAGVDTDKIEARFKNGVLTITLPKTSEVLEREKKIAIKAA